LNRWNNVTNRQQIGQGRLPSHSFCIIAAKNSIDLLFLLIVPLSFWSFLLQVQYENVITPRDLASLCDRLTRAAAIAIDTEFVSEDSYRPELCLIQVAADGDLYVIDPQTVGDVAAFWECLAAPGHVTIVHAGREELRFCWRTIGKFPAEVFDVQLAAGFVGLEHPAAYSTLVSKLLRVNLSKGETRTDWRRRPLTPIQIEYALQDVLYLDQMRIVLEQQLHASSRERWYREERDNWQRIIAASEHAENWRRVSGVSGLSTRSLAVVRELWRWREEEAERLDSPPRRILRDDLIVELARRQTSDLKRIRAVRGLERRNLQKRLPDIAARIQQALEAPEESFPQRTAKSTRPQLNLVGQFLATALGGICRNAQIATGLVGSAEDVRDLVAYRLRLEGSRASPPALAQGWRAEVVGRAIDELLQGHVAVRIHQALAEQPLEFIQLAKGD
jgi:ribonuclease D